MKKILLLLLVVIMGLNSCDLSDDGELPPAEVSVIGTFIIDATTNTFEGGAALVLENALSLLSEIPVVVNLRERIGNSTGAIGLSYSPTGLQFFDAELNQEGIPRFFKPELMDPNEFPRVNVSFSLPNTVNPLDLEGPYDEPFETTFEAIDDLEIMEIFFDGDGLFGRYLYKPSEDVPENWKWIIVAYDQ